MKTDRTRFSRRYSAALKKRLSEDPPAGSAPANGRLGRQAVKIGLDILDLAKIHGHALAKVIPAIEQSGTLDGMFGRAHAFFAEALTPLAETHRTAMKAGVDVNRLKEKLRARTNDLTAAKRQLKRETSKRKKAEEALKESERKYRLLLNKSHHMQDELRHLTHQILSAQEEERKKISRELHDGIVQTLTGINVQLATLKKEATVNTRGLTKRISTTQRLVAKSVKSVHRFARDLRPALLDDMGLIPALHSFMKDFMERTGIRVHLRTCMPDKVNQLDNIERTVLYRVAQEAVTNVAKHAQASLVHIRIQKLKDSMRMTIQDNGKSFELKRVLSAKKNKRLGLLGMRERLQMVGGTLSVESAPDKGTTISAVIPFGKGKRL
jgi:signal transduction histidine kinase